MTNSNETPQQTIDRLPPFRGPCAFCGGPDARHRIFDAIVDRSNAGEAIEDIADDLGLSEELVRVVVVRAVVEGVCWGDRIYSGISESLGGRGDRVTCKTQAIAILSRMHGKTSSVPAICHTFCNDVEYHRRFPD